jgi:hypothetical protein
VVCDDFLYIWYVNLGAPGSRNDINLYDQSKFFTDVQVGKWPEIEPEIPIGDFVLKWCYFLCDGIYPKVNHLVNSMLGDTAKENYLLANWNPCGRLLREPLLLFSLALTLFANLPAFSTRGTWRT